MGDVFWEVMHGLGYSAQSAVGAWPEKGCVVYRPEWVGGERCAWWGGMQSGVQNGYPCVGLCTDAWRPHGDPIGANILSPPSLPRTKENGLDRDPLHPEHLSKRPCTMSPAQRYSPSNGLSHPPNGLPHPPGPPPQHYRLEDMAMAHHYRDAYRHADPRERPRPGELSSLLWEAWAQSGAGRDVELTPPLPPPHAWLAAVHGARQEEVIDHRLTDREWAEEWKHLNNVCRAPCPPPAPTVFPPVAFFPEHPLLRWPNSHPCTQHGSPPTPLFPPPCSC